MLLQIILIPQHQWIWVVATCQSESRKRFYLEFFSISRLKNSCTKFGILVVFLNKLYEIPQHRWVWDEWNNYASIGVWNKFYCYFWNFKFPSVWRLENSYAQNLESRFFPSTNHTDKMNVSCSNWAIVTIFPNKLHRHTKLSCKNLQCVNQSPTWPFIKIAFSINSFNYCKIAATTMLILEILTLNSIHFFDNRQSSEKPQIISKIDYLLWDVQLQFFTEVEFYNINLSFTSRHIEFEIFHWSLRLKKSTLRSVLPILISSFLRITTKTLILLIF